MSILDRDARKRDHSYISDEKLGQSYTYSLKKEAYRIPGSAEKWDYWSAHPYYVIYR